MNTKKIEELAEEAGLFIYSRMPELGLLDRAGVDHSVYTRMKNNPSKEVYLSTATKIAAVLADALERDRDEILGLITDVEEVSV